MWIRLRLNRGGKKGKYYRMKSSFPLHYKRRESIGMERINRGINKRRIINKESYVCNFTQHYRDSFNGAHYARA